jgi:phage virion morphogenesis protein
MNDLAPLDAYCAALLANLQPSSRRQLARQIATSLRSSGAKRISAQQNPDGSPFEPRKPQKLRSKKGRIRRTMFAKMRTNRFLKTEASPDSAVVTFADQVQRIAQVHQLGLRDKVNRRRSNIEVQYPERKLLGLTDADVALVEDLVLAHLAR